jgi:hypothetical protein
VYVCVCHRVSVRLRWRTHWSAHALHCPGRRRRSSVARFLRRCVFSRAATALSAPSLARWLARLCSHIARRLPLVPFLSLALYLCDLGTRVHGLKKEARVRNERKGK